MEYIDFAIYAAYILIGIGMVKLSNADPRGFLFTALGAFTFAVCGFFMKDGGFAVTVCNIPFVLIGIRGYRRLRDR